MAGARRRSRARLVFKVILSSLTALGLLTGVGVVALYNNFNGNIDHKEIAAQARQGPAREGGGVGARGAAERARHGHRQPLG
ncbi:hypothetical protein G5V59_13160 [Nocardioides sp. W3-2-3]|uniref:hypothetical protein n=1 Tax=Nocardioides convexus TaxID=2712224 RepID=UPI0024188D63|nr:hypothetical protein [Nocardioides convexus]NHA00654.1 hypothetical protein [Nocardioides convexus]